jgi:hypothetical protein
MNPKILFACIAASGLTWAMFSGSFSTGPKPSKSLLFSGQAPPSSPIIRDSTFKLPEAPATFPGLLIKKSEDDTNSVSLGVDEVKIDITVIGNVATTIMEMNFHNDLDRILEGEFVFPLGEGQTVSSFALEIDGKMRDASIVEKAKGRMTYESVIRQKIDPGLLEWTQGNNFRSRVYPIPAKGNKRIRVGFQQELLATGGSSLYFLPLMFKEKLRQFSVHTEVVKQNVKPELYGNELVNMEFKKWKDSWVASQQMSDYLPNAPIAFEVPLTPYTTRQFTQPIGKTDSAYFYFTTTPEKHTMPKTLPERIGLVWDVSGSASSRNITKELEVLDAYLKKIGSLWVQLIAFSNEIHESSLFHIADGDWAQLKKHITELEYDGGTQMGTLDLTRYNCDEFLLFSDGISNFGSEDVLLGNIPVITLSSSQSADHSRLKYIAQKTGGEFINLLTKTTDESVAALSTQSYRFISAQFDGKSVHALCPSMPTVVSKDLAVSGILEGEEAEITLNYGFGRQVVFSEKIKVNRRNTAEGELIGNIWAQKRITELDLNYNKNKHLITALGMQHAVVTRNTSLIVLDRIEDYVTHKITPTDPELKKQYFARVFQVQQDKKTSDKERMERVVSDFKSLSDWWDTDFNVVPIKKAKNKELGSTSPNDTVLFLPFRGNVFRTFPNGDYLRDSMLIFHSNSPTLQGQGDTTIYFNTTYVISPNGDAVNSTWNFGDGSVTLNASGASNAYTFNWSSNVTALSNGLTSGSYSINLTDANGCVGSGTTMVQDRTASIKLNAWDPDTPYLKVLKVSAKKDIFKKYLELKKQHAATPAFYLDVADYLVKQNKEKLAIRVLSNIAEMQLENHELLRILAHRLQQLKQLDLAVSTFRQVLEIREEEPQSYRDLGLALAENKQYQEAVNYLAKVVNKDWDGRFPMIEAFAAGEINHIVELSDNMLNLDMIDKRLIKPMPVDVRVVLNWNTDNCDMDLWVTDPMGEKCFYGYKQTRAGGRMSMDYTGGYGPEEFIIKKALPGKYKVQVNYYGSSRQTISGPTMIQAELFTNYGRPNEKKQNITVRLGQASEVVDVGEFEFGAF